MSKTLIRPKNPELKKQLKALYGEIKSSKGVLVAGHINPDGDDICSLLAVGEFLASLGKKFLLLADETPPEYFSFLPNIGMIQNIKDLKEKPRREEFDMLIVVDCGDFDRIGDVKKVLPEGIRMVNIDHHKGNSLFGHRNIVDEKACSIGEILYYFFSVNSLPITKEIAVDLYVSIVTDTGSFKYDSMHREVHEIAADLLDLGVVPSDFNIHLFQNKSPDYMKLLTRTLSGMEFYENGKIAVSVLSFRDFQDVQCDDTDGLIEYLGMTDSVSVYILIKEKGPSGPGQISASLRSKYNVDVAKVASAFGGGGHMRAAGCKTDKLDIPEFKSELIRLVKNQL